MKTETKSELKALLTIAKGVALMLATLWLVQQFIWLLAVAY